ncbi:MAG: hypothetical protein J0H64_10650, partial [Actinobacteria bacterium]|nr:hypothetical protein [Actinomycetota bacterium]
ATPADRVHPAAHQTGAGSGSAPGGAAAPGGGLGLTGIRERVALLHGTVVAGTVADVYRLEVRLPLQDRGKEAD